MTIGPVREIAFTPASNASSSHLTGSQQEGVLVAALPRTHGALRQESHRELVALPPTSLFPMAPTLHDHDRWMCEALSRARAMQGRVWPNPAVGCVIVKDGLPVGFGETQFGGRPHAERVALADAGAAAYGASLYVTLEPCCHQGHTPPCVDAIIAAGITAVYASLQDPDPRVNGGGFAKLRAAGVQVWVGLGAIEAGDIMKGFFTRVALGRPLVTLQHQVNWGTASAVPFPFDGVLSSNGAEVSLRVLTASGAMENRPLETSDPKAFLPKLGAWGLTSVAIPSIDPLAQRCRMADLVDDEQSAI